MHSGILNENHRKILARKIRKDFATEASKDIEFQYGEFDAGLWHEAVAF
jgi:hypothetical protein